MGEFFKPWRRKLGIVTLVLACVFMGGWVRSYSAHDALNIAGHRLELSDGILELGHPPLVEGVDTFCYVVILSVHYSQVVIPLTLVSFWLLVIEHRKSNQKNNH